MKYEDLSLVVLISFILIIAPVGYSFAQLDFDGDGVDDDVDNCPFTPNPGQGDSDGDGTRDVCDFEPSNPCVPDPTSPACTPPPDPCAGAGGDTDGDGVCNLDNWM